MQQMRFAERCDVARAALADVSSTMLEGRITGVSGLMVEVAGLSQHASVGDRLSLQARSGRQLDAEIVGFRAGTAQAMIFSATDGLGPGSAAWMPAPTPRSTDWQDRGIAPDAIWSWRLPSGSRNSASVSSPTCRAK